MHIHLVTKEDLARQNSKGSQNPFEDLFIRFASLHLCEDLKILISLSSIDLGVLFIASKRP